MAFKEKLGAIAKTAADKTGDVVETTKLNIKLNEEKSKMKDHMETIGKYYYDLITAEGGEIPEAIRDEVCQIKDIEETMADLQDQIKELKSK